MIQVEVNSELRPLIPGFLGRIRADIVRCRIAVTAGHQGALKALCHKNRGCCAMYGFNKLAALFSALEHVSLADMRRGQTPALVQLERYAAQLAVTYR